MHKRLILLILIFILASFLTTAQTEIVIGEGWLATFTPTRELYVSPNGNGSGSQSSPMSLNNAITQVKPGDLVWMRAGNYNGRFVFNADGTAQKPIVFRAYPGEHVKVTGKLLLYGEYNWIWGLEVTDPNLTIDETGVAMYAEGIRLINNYIHDHKNNNGIGAWAQGPGHLVYGNIIRNNGFSPSTDSNGNPRHPHNIYTQNSFVDDGYKFFINNIIIDAGCDECFNFHAFTHDGTVTGFHLERNIIGNGNFLVGGYGLPADNNIISQNYYYNSRVQFGFRRPTQIAFTYNYLVNTTLWTEYFWGEGETLYTQSKPNVYSSNTFIGVMSQRFDQFLIRFRTSMYNAADRQDGTPRIKNTDVFDYNSYAGTFLASFFAGGNQQDKVNFDQWKQASAAAGNAFDRNSQIIPMPTTPNVVVLPNEYEAGRANIVVYNHGNANQVAIDLSSVLSGGQQFVLYSTSSVFGTPVAQGQYNGPVNVNVSGKPFSTYVVMSGSASAPGGSTPIPQPTATPTAIPKPPASGLNIDTKSNTLPIRPAFTWQIGTAPTDTANSWHNLIVYNYETAAVVVNKWYRHSSVCNGTTCSVTMDAETLPYGLINGRHGWWLQSHVDGSLSSLAAGGEFTIRVNAPAVPGNISGTYANNKVTVKWNHDPNALYYQVYVGRPEQGITAHFGWVSREAAKCNTTCELQAAVTGSGEHKIYMQAWGPGGFNGSNNSNWAGPESFLAQ